MAKKNQIAKKKKLPNVDMSNCNIAPGDAFMVVTLSMLQEPFMSSDCKQIILYNALNMLEKELGYSKEDVDVFREKMNQVIKHQMHVNSFMG